MIGPQTPHPNLASALEQVSFEGPIVTITAGWQDSEGEVEELQNDIGRPVQDLGLYHLAETVCAREPQLLELKRERQYKLKALQKLYRIRLEATLSAARTLLNSDGDAELLRLEQRAAITQVRALDRHHLKRIAAIHEDFATRRSQMELPFATSKRNEIWQRVQDAGLILVAGGHVAVLLNRIRLFRLEPLLADKPIIAWSAGAMVLGERIVLFHDNAPQGRRNAEVLDSGLGIVPKLVPLPHAKTRLDWSIPTRMALFARRFAPSRCCTLDFGSLIRTENGIITAAKDSSVMKRTGGKKRLVAK